MCSCLTLQTSPSNELELLREKAKLEHDYKMHKLDLDHAYRMQQIASKPAAHAIAKKFKNVLSRAKRPKQAPSLLLDEHVQTLNVPPTHENSSQAAIVVIENTLKTIPEKRTVSDRKHEAEMHILQSLHQKSSDEEDKLMYLKALDISKAYQLYLQNKEKL